MISTDRNLCKAGSAVRMRLEKYAAAAGEIDVILYGLRSHNLTPVDNSGVHIYPTNSSWRVFYMRDALHVARRLSKPDVVTAQDPFETGWAGMRIAQYFGVPLHVQVHTNFLAPSFTKRHFPLNFLRFFIAGFVLPRAARVRTVSNAIKNRLLKKYRLTSPPTVLPIYVDVAKYKHAIAPESLKLKFAGFERKVLVVSRLESEKNIDLAIHAFAEAASEDACLIIVGSGSKQAELERHVREHDLLEGRVFFEGFQDPTPYYKIADVALFPSDSYDGYGMVIVEALASGVPVISTDVGVAREAGAIVTAPQNFGHVLAQLLSEPKEEIVLKNYPYADEVAYVREWVADIIGASSQKV
ncbi:MAG TPA: glycosyltransferase [Candidatus Paceibacterota bacterium]|nr:glycosyltransferase [Candidatus Paceibacterota bacterium]